MVTGSHESTQPKSSKKEMKKKEQNSNPTINNTNYACSAFSLSGVSCHHIVAGKVPSDLNMGPETCKNS